MSDVNSTMETDLSSKEMDQKHVKFFHKSSFSCPLCDTPNDEKSRTLVQFYEIDYLSQLQNKNISFNRKSPKTVNRSEKSSSATGKVNDGALNHNTRLSGEISPQDTPSLKSSATEESSRTEANASISQTSKAPDIEVTGLASQLPKENDSELNALVKSIPKNNSIKSVQEKNIIQSGDEDKICQEVKQWKENDKCVAQWVEDGCWYRSVIEKIESPDKVLVKFIDYGNSDYTSLSNVQPFETVIDVNGQIGEKNPQTESNIQREVKYKLEDKQYGVIEGEDKDGLNDGVELWKEGDMCVAQWVEDGCWYRSVIEKIESPDKVLVKFIDYGNSDYTSLSNVQPFETVIDVNGQIGEKNPQTESNIQCEVKDESECGVIEGEDKDGLNEGVELWKESDMCVAQWVEDGCWYRSRIEKIESSNQVLVTFIDYGNSDYTTLSKLKPCDTIIGEDGQIKDIEIKINEEDKQGSAIDSPVDIGEAGDCIDGEETFWKEGDACVAQWKEDDLWYRSVVSKIESNDKVLVTFTDYGNSEYTSLKALKPADTKIHEDGTIEQVDDVNDVAWKVDDECVAQWEKDKCWYKSKIVRKDSNENVLVEFTEYGNSDYTTLAKLKPFNTEIVNGQLKAGAEANEKGIDESEEKSFVNVKTNEKCLWKVGDKCLAQCSGDQGWYKSVVVLIEKDGKTLVKFIQNGNLDYTTLSDLKPLGTTISVCGQVESHDTSVDHDEKFLDIPATSDCFEIKKGTGDSAVLTTNDVSSKWKVGDSCVAQWGVDGRWYKSMITKLKSSGKVKVLFIDYGNSDYTSIGLLKPPQTVIGEDGRLADESSSVVIPSMPVKLEPIAEEQLEGDAFKGDGNEEQQKMFEDDGTLETKVSVEAIEMAVDKSNNNVDTIREDNDRKDLMEFNIQEEMLAPEHDQNSEVAPTLDTNIQKQSTLMNTDTLLLESITEINPSELLNKSELKDSSETPRESSQALSATESMSKSFDGESTTELLMINNAGESTTKSRSKMDAGESNHASSDKNEPTSVNYDESNYLVSSQLKENQTFRNAAFALIEPLLKKSDALDDQPASAPESLTNNSDCTFQGRVKSLAVHEEGAKYLEAITNQDTVVRIQGELMTDALPLMLHPVASKVMQAVIDVTDNIEEILQIVLENFPTLSSDKNGSKIIQKVLTRLPCARKSAIVGKLENEEVLAGLLSSQHGTNVAQACLPYLTEGSVTCLGNFLLGNIVELGSSPNGSYFIQLFMTSNNTNIVKVFKDKVLDAIVENAEHLVKDKFGTWLAQTAAKVMESPRHILLFSGWVKDNIKDVYCDPDAMHFASSVIEALVKISSSEETDSDVNSSKRESAKILREVIFLMTDTLVEVNGSSVPLIVASSIDPYGHVLAREVCLQASYVPEIRNKFIQVFSEYKSKLEDDTFGCLVLKGLGGLL